MKINEQTILAIWAHGGGAVSKRLAKRAWHVLEDFKKTSPRALQSTWSNASEAQHWVDQFRSMGLMGLVDAARKGRPLLYESKVKKSKEEIAVLEGLNTIQKQILHELSKKEREALWRSNRNEGRTLIRDSRGLDIPIPVPDGFQNLAGIFLSPNIKIFALVKEISNPWFQLNGTWVGIPKQKIKSGINLSSSANFIDALSIKISSDIIKNDLKTNGNFENYLLLRYLSRIKEICADKKVKINLSIFFHINESNQLIKIFKEMRKMQLWESRNFTNSGLLDELNIIPIGNSFPMQMQTFIAKIFPDATGDQMADFLDRLTITRPDYFCWIREDDRDELSESSDWQAIAMNGKRKLNPDEIRTRLAEVGRKLDSGKDLSTACREAGVNQKSYKKWKLQYQ